MLPNRYSIATRLAFITKCCPGGTLATVHNKASGGENSQREGHSKRVFECDRFNQLAASLYWEVKSPRCFRGLNKDTLSLIYRNQKNAWVDIFSDWFHNSCVPFVQKALVKQGFEPKAKLFLDNCSAHPH